MTVPRKSNSWHPRAIVALGVGVAGIIVAVAQSGAQSPKAPPLPSLSRPLAAQLRSNPALWDAFVSQLPPGHSGNPQPTPQPVSPPFGGTWQVVKNAPPGSPGFCNPLLLTDGTVILHDCGNPGTI